MGSAEDDMQDLALARKDAPFAKTLGGPRGGDGCGGNAKKQASAALDRAPA